jgi:hypothetical protein
VKRSFTILLLLWGTLALGGEAFRVRLRDRSIEVKAPAKRTELFAVIIENQSLSPQIAKFMLKDSTLKFISVDAGSSETVEIENKTADPVVLVPVSPSFEEVELLFGKKDYEIPAKQ